ncbi:MAG: GtrA family protein [Acholeplasmatales bacterium]|nr:GtrA family protein [Acholeplasmatales bacterium]
MKQSKSEIIREIIRFLIVGGIATIVDYIVFYTFNLVILKNVDITLNLFISTTLGFLAGLLVNWFLQKFVYKYIDESQTKSKKVFMKFVVVSVIGLGITQLGILLAEPIYNTYYWTIIITFDFWKLFMKCLMTCIVLVFNYVCRKLFVFKK